MTLLVDVVVEDDVSRRGCTDELNAAELGIAPHERVVDDPDVRRALGVPAPFEAERAVVVAVDAIAVEEDVVEASVPCWNRKPVVIGAMFGTLPS